jgi:putative endonuclease
MRGRRNGKALMARRLCSTVRIGCHPEPGRLRLANGGEGSAVCRGKLQMSRTYWIYILASRSRNMYTGVTNDLHRRMIEHRQGLVPGFTSRYKIFRLVHCEQFADIRDAIAREKEIKGWRREKKIWLIERDNPTWQDFAENFAPVKK